MSDSDSRAEFEAWAIGRNWSAEDLRRSELRLNWYAFETIQLMWDAWQAATAAERERAKISAEAYRAANPLGGPAKMFDAIADQIRAGDDYYAVLADFGICSTEEARRMVLDERERAAKVCAGNSIVSGSPGPLYTAGWHKALESCAAAIRKGE